MPEQVFDPRRGSLKMTEVIAEICRVFALTVREKKTETLCMHPPRAPRTMMSTEAAGQTCKQVQWFPCTGDAGTEISYQYMLVKSLQADPRMLDAHQAVPT